MSYTIHQVVCVLTGASDEMNLIDGIIRDEIDIITGKNGIDSIVESAPWPAGDRGSRLCLYLCQSYQTSGNMMIQYIVHAL